ncbi:hypothetical protein Sm713_22920 [Streptomyces sp. TS71-3]|nr:hypothetical protein Sm713_22920 [Streptomyces sp. TS71-3]
MTQTSGDRQTAPGTLQDAETVRDELDTALRSRGVTLPSLCVEALAYADRDGRRPLIQLGRCNLETARKLSAVLTDAAAPTPEPPTSPGTPAGR